MDAPGVISLSHKDKYYRIPFIAGTQHSRIQRQQAGEQRLPGPGERGGELLDGAEFQFGKMTKF